MKNVIDTIYEYFQLDMPLMKLGIQIGIAIAVLIIGFIIVKIVGRYFNNILNKRQIDPTIKPFLSSLFQTGLKIMVILFAASVVGVKTASLAAVFGAVVFAIGMALQGSLGHFASGVLILVFKPYKIGDKIEVAGHSGKVKEIQIFNTIIITSDNKTVIVPNGVITKNAIVNHSKEGIIRVDMVFGVGYQEDIDQVRAIIQSVSDNCPYLVSEKQTDIFVSELAADSVNFVVRPWCKSELFWDVHFYMHEHIKKQLDANNVSIPYPQMDIHVVKDEA